jgi:excisionase family DNA binding protein
MSLLKVNEAAARIRMSPSWIRLKIYKKELPHLKIGARVFIEESTLDELLKRARREPRDGSKLCR